MNNERELVYTYVDNNVVGKCFKSAVDKNGNSGEVEYYYYSYELSNIKDVNNKNSIVFKTRVASETLLLGLIKYYKPIVEQLDQYVYEKTYSGNKKLENMYNNVLFKYFLNNVVVYHRIGNDYSHNRDLYALNNNVINDYLNSNKSKFFTQEMVIKFLVYYYGMFDEDMNIDNFVKDYCNKYVKINNFTIDTLYNDDPSVLYYCVPIMSLFTINELKFIQARDIRNRSVANLHQTPAKWIKLYYKIFNIKNNTYYYDDTILVKDYVINDNVENNFNLPYISNNSMIKTDELYDYLINLPVIDFLRIDNFIHYLTTDDEVKHFKDYCNILIKNDFVLHTTKVTSVILDDFTKLLNDHGIDGHSLHISNYSIREEKVCTMFIDHVTTMLLKDEESANKVVNDLDNLKDCLDFTRSDWFMNYIVYLLIEKFSNEDVVIVEREVINFTADVVRNNIDLTAEQWLSFINNYDEYKDMPLSWSADLI